MADGSIKFDIEILDKRAKEKMKELENAIEETGDNIDESLSNSSSKFIADWNKAESDYQKIASKIETNAKKLNEAINAEIKADQEHGIKSDQYQQALENVQRLQNVQDGLIAQEQQLIVKKDSIASKTSSITEQLREQSRLEEENKQKISFKDRLLKSVSTTASNIKDKITQQSSELSKSNANANKLKSSSKDIGKSFTSSLKSLMRVSLAMLGIRGVMTGVNKITREWYNSNNAGAKQAQANMSAMSSGLVNLLAPALSFITNLMATLFGYINAIAVAFFGVNLLSKGTSKNLGTGASNAKKLGKELKGFTASFDEADVASSNLADNLDGAGGGGGGAIDLEPNIKTPDLSKFKEELERLFKPFLDTIKSINFEPLKQSFNDLVVTGKESLEILGMSFVRMTNDTVAPFIKLMAEDIIPKGLNTINRTLKRLNPVIDKLLKTFVEPLCGWFMLKFVPAGLDLVFSIFEALGGILAVVIESFNIFWDSAVGRAIAFVGGELILAIMGDLKNIFDTITEGIDAFFVSLEEGDPIAQAIAFTLGAIVSGLIAWKVATLALTVVQGGLNVVVGAFNALMALNPFALVIVGVVALIAIIIALWDNWEAILEFFKETINNLIEWFVNLGAKIWEALSNAWNKVKEVWQGVKDWFNNTVIQPVADFFGNMWKGLKDGAANAWQGIKNIFSTVASFFANIFGNAWNGVKNIFSTGGQIFMGIVDGIVSAFKNIVNTIIDGINRVVAIPFNAINAALNGIRGISILGAKPFGWLPTIGVPQIPRLAKGGVLTSQTTATMAEYPNARTNPEIVTPQKIMRETLAQALAESGTQGNSQPTTIIVQTVLDGRVVAETVNEVNTSDNFQLNGGNLAWNM